MREHDALGFTGCPRGVDDGGELAGKNLRGADAVSRDIGVASGPQQRVIQKAFGRHIRTAFRNNNMLDSFEAVAIFQEALGLHCASGENDAGLRMVQDVSHPLGRLVEIDGHRRAACAGDGKVGDVPLGTVRGEKADAVARFDAQFHQGGGESRNTAQQFSGGDGFPTGTLRASGGRAAKHLRARIRFGIDCVQELRGKRAVVHGLGVTVPQRYGWRNAATGDHVTLGLLHYLCPGRQRFPRRCERPRRYLRVAARRGWRKGD